MHLLVLSAFRLDESITQHFNLEVSMHLLVLSAFRRRRGRILPRGLVRSQCTFWCSVLSDGKPSGTRGVGMSRLNAPFGAQCFPT